MGLGSTRSSRREVLPRETYALQGDVSASEVHQGHGQSKVQSREAGNVVDDISQATNLMSAIKGYHQRGHQVLCFEYWNVHGPDECGWRYLHLEGQTMLFLVGMLSHLECGAQKLTINTDAYTAIDAYMSASYVI